MKKQKYDSARTNVNQIPAAFKKIPWTNDSIGTVNLDFGGGKYDTGTKYLRTRGITSLVYDPFNRSKEHNAFVERFFKAYGADSVTCCNVLNVIKEPEVRLQVLRKIKRLVKPYMLVWISVYRGRGNKPTLTRNGWQENRPLSSYLPEVRKVFPNARIDNGMINCCKGFFN